MTLGRWREDGWRVNMYSEAFLLFCNLTSLEKQLDQFSRSTHTPVPFFTADLAVLFLLKGEL